MDDLIKSLFKQIEKAFNQSDIKDYAEKHGKKWFYYLSSTRLTKNTTVIVGFNGGAKEGIPYEPLMYVPDVTFGDLFRKGDELKSLSRIYYPLKSHLKDEDVDSFVQINFCFFRSDSESKIRKEDVELCVPIFEQLMSHLKPRRIIGFSARLRDYILNNKMHSQLDTKNIESNNKTVYAVKGQIKFTDISIPFCILPHPNYPITSKARNEAWEFCFPDIQKERKK